MPMTMNHQRYCDGTITIIILPFRVVNYDEDKEENSDDDAIILSPLFSRRVFDPASSNKDEDSDSDGDNNGIIILPLFPNQTKPISSSQDGSNGNNDEDQQPSDRLTRVRKILAARILADP
mmetsp:Transcript_23109/g.47104  ORF Transcript_23109/g.47104 Transcript_23109/m.47104 type:complete len:121 (+) Transcript_23109:1401-1763(+)